MLVEGESCSSCGSREIIVERTAEASATKSRGIGGGALDEAPAFMRVVNAPSAKART